MAKNKIAFEHHYDKDADILYITLGDEPSYTENIDDMLMLDIGCFSGLPQGFRILGPKYHQLKAFNLSMMVKRIEKRVIDLAEKKRKEIADQEPILRSFCEQIPDFITQVL